MNSIGQYAQWKAIAAVSLLAITTVGCVAEDFPPAFDSEPDGGIDWVEEDVNSTRPLVPMKLFKPLTRSGAWQDAALVEEHRPQLESYIARGEYSHAKYREELDGKGPIGQWSDRSQPAGSNESRCVGPQPFKHPHRTGAVVRPPSNWTRDPSYPVHVEGNGTLRIDGSASVAPSGHWSLIAPPAPLPVWAVIQVRFVERNATAFVGIQEDAAGQFEGGSLNAAHVELIDATTRTHADLNTFRDPGLPEGLREVLPDVWNAFSRSTPLDSRLRHHGAAGAIQWSTSDDLQAAEGTTVSTIPAGSNLHVEELWLQPGTAFRSEEAQVFFYSATVAIALDDGRISHGNRFFSAVYTGSERPTPHSLAARNVTIFATGGGLHLNQSRIATDRSIEADQVLYEQGSAWPGHGAVRPACRTVRIDLGSNWWVGWSINETTNQGAIFPRSVNITTEGPDADEALWVYVEGPAEPEGLAVGSRVLSKISGHDWNEFHMLLVPWKAGDYKVTLSIRGDAFPPASASVEVSVR